MSVKVLWYISPVDGRFPWSERGRYPVEHSRLRRLAQTLDDSGFYGALLGTYAQDVFITASTIAAFTRTLRFLIPIYPGLTVPRLLAQQTLTFDEYTGGRLLLNLVNGQDAHLADYGQFLPHDARYERSAEYWRLFTDFYEGKSPSYQGTYLDPARTADAAEAGRAAFGHTGGTATNLPLRPVQHPHVPLWGAGASRAGQEFAGRIVETYLTFLREPQSLAAQIDGAKAAAARHGRSFTGLGTHASVTVRASAAEAREHFYSLLETTGVDEIRDRAELTVKGVTAGRDSLRTFTAPDPRRQGWADALAAGRLPTLAELEIAPHTYAGLTPWSSLDVVGVGTGTYLVGDPDQVTGAITDLHDNLGIDTVILAAWPLIQEATYTAELLSDRIAEIP